MFTNVLTALSRFTWADLIDILLVAFILYALLLLIKETRALPLALGVGIVGLVFLITRWGKLVVSNWIIKNFVPYLIIAVIILFQGEVRRFLTGLGSRTIRKPLVLRSFQEKIDDLVEAVAYMSHRKIGALIGIEKEISLETFADRGTRINAVVSKDLLVSLFFPQSPLHDGAVLIRGSGILAAGCLLPLPAGHHLRTDLLTRTRHLAAIGLSLESDAAVIVVSETTGGISLAVKGELVSLRETDELRKRLLEHLKT
jgi:diadenylate cyclase